MKLFQSIMKALFAFFFTPVKFNCGHSCSVLLRYWNLEISGRKRTIPFAPRNKHEEFRQSPYRDACPDCLKSKSIFCAKTGELIIPGDAVVKIAFNSTWFSPKQVEPHYDADSACWFVHVEDILDGHAPSGCFEYGIWSVNGFQNEVPAATIQTNLTPGEDFQVERDTHGVTLLIIR